MRSMYESFNLEWNCFNIHAIVYYECFFHTTSSFLDEIHASKFIISSLIPIIVFCSLKEGLGEGGKNHRWNSLFCMLCLVLKRHISVLNSDTLKAVVEKVAETTKLPNPGDEKACACSCTWKCWSKWQFFIPYLLLTLNLNKFLKAKRFSNNEWKFIFG